jgi:hypothetical protein
MPAGVLQVIALDLSKISINGNSKKPIRGTPITIAIIKVKTISIK